MTIKNPIFRWLVAAVSVFSASALGAQTLFSTGLQIEFRVFAGGVNRIYSNANEIVTGKILNSQVGQKRRGLGYHHPKLGGDFGAADAYFHHTIIPYLKAMLPPKAADWIYQAENSNWTGDLIWLNGDMALELGISTSDQIPDGCSL